MKLSVLPMTFFGALAAAQSISLYSDTACATLIQTVSCSDAYMSCVDLTAAASSYSIDNGDSNICDNPEGLYDIWSVDTDCSSSATNVGGGCDTGCMQTSGGVGTGVVCSETSSTGERKVRMLRN